MGKTIVVGPIQPSDTITDIKTKIQSLEGTHPDLHQLFYDGKLLQDRHAVSDYNIPNRSTLSMLPVKGRRGKVQHR